MSNLERTCRLNESVFIADRGPDIIAWRFKTNELFCRFQKVNLIDCYCEEVPRVFIFSQLLFEKDH